MTDISLRIESLSVEYGKFQALRDATLEIEAGSIVGLVGPNSAGKTSLLEGVVGASLGKCSGGVWLDGERIDRLSTHDRSIRGLRLVPQGRQLFPSLSVTENLRVVVDEMGENWPVSIGRASEMFPEVFRDRGRDLAGNLSGGQQQMVALARATIGSPRVLVLDEPALGLAAAIVQRVREFAHELADQGITVLIADQSLHLWEETVSNAYVLVRGVLEGTVSSQQELVGVLGHS